MPWNCFLSSTTRLLQFFTECMPLKIVCSNTDVLRLFYGDENSTQTTYFCVLSLRHHRMTSCRYKLIKSPCLLSGQISPVSPYHAGWWWSSFSFQTISLSFIFSVSSSSKSLRTIETNGMILGKSRFEENSKILLQSGIFLDAILHLVLLVLFCYLVLKVHRKIKKYTMWEISFSIPSAA